MFVIPISISIFFLYCLMMSFPNSCFPFITANGVSYKYINSSVLNSTFVIIRKDNKKVYKTINFIYQFSRHLLYRFILGRKKFTRQSVAALRKKIRTKNLPTVFFSQSDKADIMDLTEAEGNQKAKNFCSIKLSY